MQRVIKFRAWDRKEQKMCDDALQITNVGLGDGSLVVTEDVQKGNELDWMQFTGLLDKNGREIYEGDIVNINSNEGMITSKIYWDNFRSRFDGTNTDYFDYFVLSKAIEVIGNVFENPELIKES